MVSPFPGFNPYLEHPAIWPGIHHWLIIGLAGYLSPQLRPQYRVAVEVRMYETIGEQSLLVGIPDVTVNQPKRNQAPDSQESRSGSIATIQTKPQRVTVPVTETVKQGYLEVREVSTGQVITAIEILSPVNKRMGKGRQQYEEKRNRILNTQTHLVEIDLLREGKPMMVLGEVSDSDYRILVSRGDCRPQADLYGFDLQDPIPTFPLPLKKTDENVLVNLEELLQNVYEQGSFDLAIDYAQPPNPPLSSENSDWVDKLLKAKDLR
ncbi:MAG: DUF4058 family protein [Cyanobacteria bacterium P01_F01_bin.116]